jgi:hypothetical protein
MEKKLLLVGMQHLKNMRRLNFDVSSEGPSSELLVVGFVVVFFVYLY